MKKIILGMMAAAVLLTACDPITDSKEWSGHKTEQFSISTKQYNMDANGKYVECADGNYIEFFTSPSTIVEAYYVAKDGSERSLSKGKASGMMSLFPTRGSDPNQTIYFRTYELDGSSVTMSTNVTVQVATELAPEVKLLASNSGTKKWKWMPTSVNNGGAVWGNGAYQAGAQDGSENINGAWWGCGPLDGECGDTFEGQLGHSAVGQITGEEYLTAYMEFGEDGSLKKFDKDGNQLNAGTYAVDGWNGGAAIDDLGNVAYLNTSAGAILWPYAINMNGFQPERFEVAYLSVDRMILIYAPEGTGGWNECTWWSFASDDDAPGFLAANKWGWAPTAHENGAVWGNAGYQAGAQDGSENINGVWWGCGVEDGTANGTFSSQLGHSAAGQLTGEEYSTSYMTFSEDGILAKFDKDGNKMGEGSYSVDMTPTADWNVGTMQTSAGAILWPYAINMNGFQPEKFEIGYVSGSRLILIYAPEGTGGWSECTWWSFGKQ